MKIPAKIELDLIPQRAASDAMQLEEAIGDEASWYAEGDGSFSLAAPSASPPWHLYGMLYDDSTGFIRRVELRGNCPLATIQKIVHAIAVDGLCDVFDRISGKTYTAIQAERIWNA